MMKKTYSKQKIDTYISAKDVNRLRLICKRSGLGSIYKLLQYLVYCFLRVADPEGDAIDETMPIDIAEMFISPKEYKRLKKRLKKNPSKDFEFQLLIPFGEYKGNKVQKATITKEGIRLSKEIEEMFADNAEWEKCEQSKGSHREMNIRQKPDQRKIKSPDDIR